MYRQRWAADTVYGVCCAQPLVRIAEHGYYLVEVHNQTHEDSPGFDVSHTPAGKWLALWSRTQCTALRITDTS